MAKRRRSSKDKPNGAMVKRKRPGSQLGDLPMDILCHIISLLLLKEAVRTGILSKHWRYVWCSRTNLEFSFRSVMRRSYKGGPFILHPIQERAILPEKPLKFIHLRHLRLEITFLSLTKRKSDVLDFASLLEAAPLMEKLEFHMWMDCECVRYRKLDGKLRSLPPKPHYHLKLVDITEFYGEKDQLELALYILRNSVALEAMTIDPKPTVAAEQCRLTWKKDGFSYVDGYRVAKKYLLRADHRGVVDVVKAGRKDIEALRNAPYKMPQEAT
ncbi:uncharacterized protein LOC125539002 isoform X2 [Triticum urartu]|uniref:uncharacterized protein LOC125539002 isoform X2 n=1 Tax=Triticum urartu TaxID=4572 RepID=UPI002042DA93|nr:uncharacterized protein LOC125539002 isoform X2 [Triticum urartu]